MEHLTKLNKSINSKRLPYSGDVVCTVTQAAPLRSECLLDPDARQRGVDANAKSAGNTQWLQLPAATSHHREVVSRGGYYAFVRPSEGCADEKASVARPYPADACRPPSAPCGDGAGSTNWTALSTWQPLDGHAPPPNRTNHASRRPPTMGTRQPIPLLPTGKPLRDENSKHHHHHVQSMWFVFNDDVTPYVYVTMQITSFIPGRAPSM